MAEQAAAGRCPMCRATVRVESRYSDGDQIECENCGMLLKVLRGDGLRLVVADVGRVREELHGVQQRIRNTQAELAVARASFGIGANGLGLGLVYVLARVGLEELPLSRGILWEAVGIALVTGILLELANHLFLAKRREISRLSAELKEDETHARHLRSRLREAR